MRRPKLFPWIALVLSLTLLVACDDDTSENGEGPIYTPVDAVGATVNRGMVVEIQQTELRAQTRLNSYITSHRGIAPESVEEIPDLPEIPPEYHYELSRDRRTITIVGP